MSVWAESYLLNGTDTELTGDKTMGMPPYLTDQMIEDLRARNEQLELVASYAQDLVRLWPTIIMRTLGQATNKINALREALELVRE